MCTPRATEQALATVWYIWGCWGPALGPYLGAQGPCAPCTADRDVPSR